VVFLAGPRQAGKSTLARAIAEDGGPGPARPYLTLDDPGVQAAAVRDPVGFVSGLGGPAVIDEVQRAPGLFRAIKMAVDRDPTPGRFLLTGSADVLLLPRLADALVGRTEVLTLWPLSQGEIAGVREGWVDAAFGDAVPRAEAAPLSRPDLTERILTGGYPEPALRGRREEWFASYVATLLHRDVRDLSRIEQIAGLPPLLELLAARAGGLLNTSELSRTAAVPLNTLRRYLALFETLLLVQRLPAWSGSATRRLARAPKLLFTDAGLMAWLLHATAARLAAAPTLSGPLLENFVVMEVRKQLGWSRTRAALFHYRSHAGHEVDLVLDGPAGRLVGVEVKASRTVTPDDLGGLRALAADRPERFHRGLVLYTGDAVIPFGPRLHAAPVSTLWTWHPGGV
jgi:hypothetical protein